MRYPYKPYRRRTPGSVYLVLTLLSVLMLTIGYVLGNWVGRASAVEVEPEPVMPEVIMADAPRFTELEPMPEPTPQIVSLGEFKITHYCPCSKCCGKWADGITYTGTTATEGRTIAVDPEVIPLGTTVFISGEEYLAEDIGGAIQGSRIDIFMESHEAALVEGVKTAEVFVYE